MRRVSGGIVLLAVLVLGVVALIDDWRDARGRLEDFRHAEAEWMYWIESSCDFSSGMAELLAEQLASWSSFAPSELLSDFAHVRSLQAQVVSELRPAIKVPTELSGFILYRLRQAASTLPKHRSPSSYAIDSCAQDLHEAMVAFKRQVQEETDEWVYELCEDEGLDSWRDAGLLECTVD